MILAGITILIAGFFLGRSQTLLLGQNNIPQTSTPSIAQQSNTLPANTPNPTPTITSVSTSSTSTVNSNSLPQSGGGPQNDIIEIQQISASKAIAQVGDDISFTVTIKNQAPYQKILQAICFNSSETNFGCTQGKNLVPGEIFNINNSGRFHSPGTKSIWITWTQDNITYYRPVNAGTAQVTIQ